VIISNNRNLLVIDLLPFGSHVTKGIHEIRSVAVGDILPSMPLFLDLHAYVTVPLEMTAEAAYRGVPKVWRDVLETEPPTV
jgi:hypothetical protein